MTVATSAMHSDYMMDNISSKGIFFLQPCCRHVGRYDRNAHPDVAACVSGSTAEAPFVHEVLKLHGNSTLLRFCAQEGYSASSPSESRAHGVARVLIVWCTCSWQKVKCRSIHPSVKQSGVPRANRAPVELLTWSNLVIYVQRNIGMETTQHCTTCTVGCYPSQTVHRFLWPNSGCSL